MIRKPEFWWGVVAAALFIALISVPLYWVILSDLHEEINICHEETDRHPRGFGDNVRR
ncbi:hypothetical protein SEA_LITTLELAF_101 [Mycobacterium phage LittleLaf]|uniref:Uncharacterized protein n=2 Tax=Marvinvirus marvin TaxID=1982092 RepID=A0A385UFZ7_9CAUD|nr:hypothetical protein SEA_LITTLELAF_101 [Mycobacterium phage LittleLaf]QFP97653.1 hypothetical protein SEA_CORAZON_98 [Mycobacterium phage Corazon]URP22596.1 hypothetical protein SEA_HUPHLEPUFF_105 [Mycobacterium phage Huphlepuff]WAA20208.1 membrane protein [Mycobacterium phage Clarkson]